MTFLIAAAMSSVGGSVTTYTWDAENRPIGITFPDLSYPLLRRAKGGR